MPDPELDATVRRLTTGKSPRQARIAVFQFVRDLPYDYPSSRDPVEVLKARRGSCSGKHALLAEMLSALGYETKLMYARYNLGDLPVAFPPEVRAALADRPVTDIHNFVRVRINGRWVTLDATWDGPLASHGFPANLHWDGESDTTIAAGPCEPFEASQEQLEREKEALLRQLPPQVYDERRRLLTALAQRLRQLRGEV